MVGAGSSATPRGRWSLAHALAQAHLEVELTQPAQQLLAGLLVDPQLERRVFEEEAREVQPQFLPIAGPRRLQPTTLPTAISSCPRRADMREVTSSGVRVPAATMVRPMMVRPMMVSETPSPLATPAAPPMSTMLDPTPFPAASPGRQRARAGR